MSQSPLLGRTEVDPLVGHSVSHHQRYDQVLEESQVNLRGKTFHFSDLTESVGRRSQDSLTYSSSEADLRDLAGRVDEQASCCTLADLTYNGGIKKKLFRAAVVAGIAVGVAFLVSNPVGWTIAAIAGTAFGVYFLAQLVFHAPQISSDTKRATAIAQRVNLDAKAVESKQMAKFHSSAYYRLGKDNFNTIFTHGNGAQLILGALPNNKNEDQRRIREHAGGPVSVLSINEPWERYNFGSSEPVKPQQWDTSQGHQYHGMNVLDHIFLKPDELHQAADYIHAELSAGRSVYVHCRAGVGRSAMGLAAYLMKYQGMSANDAAALIKTQRPKSTIYNKLEDDPKLGLGLYTFEREQLGRV